MQNTWQAQGHDVARLRSVLFFGGAVLSGDSRGMKTR